mmetsp:Transcript_33884/g.61177  ORF Transcript_33884/g.61177 Transcript_33884/m.61177 type:complete len:241 (-) Transcript_33884:332-1054(-)
MALRTAASVIALYCWLLLFVRWSLLISPYPIEPWNESSPPLTPPTPPGVAPPLPWGWPRKTVEEFLEGVDVNVDKDISLRRRAKRSLASRKFNFRMASEVASAFPRIADKASCTALTATWIWFNMTSLGDKTTGSSESSSPGFNRVLLIADDAWTSIGSAVVAGFCDTGGSGTNSLRRAAASAGKTVLMFDITPTSNAAPFSKKPTTVSSTSLRTAFDFTSRGRGSLRRFMAFSTSPCKF